MMRILTWPLCGGKKRNFSFRFIWNFVAVSSAVNLSGQHLPVSCCSYCTRYTSVIDFHLDYLFLYFCSLKHEQSASRLSKVLTRLDVYQEMKGEILICHLLHVLIFNPNIFTAQQKQKYCP